MASTSNIEPLSHDANLVDARHVQLWFRCTMIQIHGNKRQTRSTQAHQIQISNKFLRMRKSFVHYLQRWTSGSTTTVLGPKTGNDALGRRHFLVEILGLLRALPINAPGGHLMSLVSATLKRQSSKDN